MSYFDPGTGQFVLVDGQIVERDALYIAERLAEYDENLCILCLDPSRAESITEEPFMICEMKPNGIYVRIFGAWAIDERILERVYNADTNRHNLIAVIEGREIAMKKESESRYKEKIAESHDAMVAAIKNPSSSFSIRNKEGDLVKIHENAPRTINNDKKSFSSVGNPSVS